MAEIRPSGELARLMLIRSSNDRGIVQRRSKMTNFQSLAGGAVWMAIAAMLMLMTFEPVSVEKKPAAAPAHHHTA
jgi:hypothetical protein